MASVALLGVLTASEFDCETSDEFVSDDCGVCANAVALINNAGAKLNDVTVFMECSCVQMCVTAWYSLFGSSLCGAVRPAYETSDSSAPA